MEANMKGHGYLCSVFFAVLTVMCALAVIDIEQMIAMNIGGLLATDFNWTHHEPMLKHGTITDIESPVLGFRQSNVTEGDIYLDFHNLLDCLCVPFSCFDLKFADVCFLLLFVIMAVLLWKQNGRAETLRSEYSLLSKEFNSTSSFLHHLRSDIQECKREMKSTDRFTKRLKTLDEITDANAQELKKVSRDLHHWKTSWKELVKQKKEKLREEKSAATNIQNNLIKRERFEDFIKWNDDAISHVYLKLSYHQWWLHDVYAKLNDADGVSEFPHGTLL